MNILKPSSRTPYIVAGFAVLLLVAAAIFMWLNPPSNPEPTTVDGTSVTPAPSTLSEEDAAAKKAYIEAQNKTDTSSSGKSTNALSTGISLDVSQKNSSVVISTQITSIGGGSCALTITNGSKSYSASADVIYQPSYSTCAGFSVPISELGTGTWKITLTAKGLDGQNAQKATSIEVT